MPVLLAAALAVVLLAGPGPQPAGEVPGDELHRYLQARTTALGVPGAAAAVVGPAGSVATAAVGQDGDGRPVTDRTPFLWGSVSKPVAATLVVRLAAQGRIDLDEPVARRLPTFAPAPLAWSGRVTVRHLLTHTSGLPEVLAATDVDDPSRRGVDAVEDLAAASLVAPPGAAHRYASANYLVLAAFVEQVTGRPFAAELTETVLAPLGLAGAVTTPAQSARDLPPGHRFVAGLPVAARPPFDPAGLAYGYLGGTIDDLAAFARADLGGDPQVVGAEELAALHAPGVPTSGGGSYGLGRRHGVLADLGVDSDERIRWHGGATPGYQSAIVVLPDRERAVVVVQNAYGPFQDEALLRTATNLAALVVGAPPAPETRSPWPLVAITALGALALGLLAAVVGLGRELTGRRRTRRRPVRSAVLRAVARVGAAAATIVALGVLLPTATGVPLTRLALWAPDLAALSWAGIVLAAVLGAGALVALRHRRA